MSRKYIIFRADWSEEQGAENRILSHTGAITDILAIICYCQYSPVSTPLEPLLKIQVSQEMQEVEA